MSKQIELENFDLKQQINLIGNIERERDATEAIKATTFFINEEQEETTFDFSQNSVTVVWYV